MIDPTTAAGTEELLRLTPGGVVVVHRDESTYGHFERVPVDYEGDGSVVAGTEPSVVIADQALSGVNSTTRGINEQVTVDGDLWYVRGVVAADADGGTIRLMLSESRHG